MVHTIRCTAMRHLHGQVQAGGGGVQAHAQVRGAQQPRVVVRLQPGGAEGAPSQRDVTKRSVLRESRKGAWSRQWV